MNRTIFVQLVLYVKRYRIPIFDVFLRYVPISSATGVGWTTHLLRRRVFRSLLVLFLLVTLLAATVIGSSGRLLLVAILGLSLVHAEEVRSGRDRAGRVVGRGRIFDKRHREALGDTIGTLDKGDVQSEVVPLLHGAPEGTGGRITGATVGRRRDHLADEVERNLKVLAAREVEDGHGADLLFGVLRQLAEELVAINEGAAHGGDGHADGAGVEDEAVVVLVDRRYELGLVRGYRRTAN